MRRKARLRTGATPHHPGRAVAPLQAAASPGRTPAAELRRLQRALGNRLLQRMLFRQHQRREPGRPLPPHLLKEMAAAFGGADFSDVRIFEDSPAARAIGARAYTQGSEVHLAPGEPGPESRTGQALIAHELTHVLQQRAGRAQPDAATPLDMSEDLEAEADDLGRRAAEGEEVGVDGAEAPDVLRAPLTPQLVEEEPLQG
jgi:hypothetical protein